MEDFPDFPNAFERNFGRGETYREFTESDHNRLSGRLPVALLDVLRKEGLASYKRQSLWFCDPDDLLAVKASWLDSFPKSEIFLRTSFGDFFFWDGKYCWTCLVHQSSIVYSAINITWFLGETLFYRPFLKSVGVPGWADRGRKACGPLLFDEVYIFEPALAIGGDPSSSKIGKGKLDVALDILSQLQPISVQQINRA